MISDFNNPGLARPLLDDIARLAEKTGPVRLMEVCGTHTMAIGRFGLRRLLSPSVRLVSGPGCPVCVTPADYIDQAAGLALERGIPLTTFGDMIRVPGLKTSLETARTKGADIRVVTSPAEALSPDRETVFLAVGFETTAAPIAATLDTAVREKLSHLSFYTSIKTIPRTLEVLATDPACAIDGFILPGHVSAIIGAKAYRAVRRPSVITGFEALDILSAIRALLTMITEKKNNVQNHYTRVVTENGNPRALALFQKYFQPSDQPWRGIGSLPGCSLSIKPDYARFDAATRYGLTPLSADMPEGCACGRVLQGAISPAECPLFAASCTPDAPIGPCMVSSEGACAAWFHYERDAA
ncbi:MAG: hydrogenase formation protein HypD [Fibrobacterota bacterium]